MQTFKHIVSEMLKKEVSLHNNLLNTHFLVTDSFFVFYCLSVD